MNILIIVGSLRQGSINKALATAIMSVGEGIKFEEADISQIPLYNADQEANMPDTVKTLKTQIRATDGVIIITPEYNRSVPGVLKNALDWTSRPYGDNAWDGKPVAIGGATAGLVGTANAQAHLRDVLAYLNTHLMGQPELYLGNFATRIGPTGEILDPKTTDFLKTFVEKFKAHIAIFKK